MYKLVLYNVSNCSLNKNIMLKIYFYILILKNIYFNTLVLFKILLFKIDRNIII